MGIGNVDITVIIATRNRCDGLPTCLAHLEQQTLPAAQFEVIVADAGSTDDTASVVSRFAAGAPMRTQILRRDSPDLAAARNFAVKEAEGPLLLFLDDGELASPRLLERHVQAHGRRAHPGWLSGEILPHPQLPGEAITRLALDGAPERTGLNPPPPYLTAQWSNISMPRELFDSFDGFSEDARYRTMEHIELAYRMFRKLIDLAPVDDGRSYIWQPVRLDRERIRAYDAGYSLYHLLRLTGSKEILHRYHVQRTRFEQVADRFLLPRYLRACRRSEAGNDLFAATLYRRVVHCDRARGFEDAREDRTRRPPEVQE